MARWEEIGQFGDAGATFREDLFGPTEKGRYGAFNDFLIDTQCILLSALENGSRAAGADALANGWAFTRGFNGCYAQAPPPFTKQTDDGKFEGGQCPGTRYDITVTWEQSSPGFGATRTNDMFGPIEGLDVIPNPNFANSLLLVLIGRTSTGAVNQIVLSSANNGRTFTFKNIDDIVVLSGPDNCGNHPTNGPAYPDGRELPPPPSDGDELVPGRDINAPVDTPIGPIDKGTEIGPALYCADGSICITVDDIPHRIRPDGGIDRAPDSAGEGGNPATDSDLIEEIAEELNTEVSGTFDWVNCAGEETSAAFLGNGFNGVKAMLATLTGLVNQGVNGFCSLLSEDNFQGNQVESTTITSSEVDSFVDIVLKAETIRVLVDVTTTTNPYAVRAGTNGGNDNIQSRFAVVSSVVEVDGNDAVLWTMNQYYSMSLYDAPPESFMVRKIRVSLNAGSTAVIEEYE